MAKVLSISLVLKPLGGGKGKKILLVTHQRFDLTKKGWMETL
jgi:glutathione synthase/RimK-type ligase-like ATP-grasp enzyme